MRIIIDVGYYGKEITSMKNYSKYSVFDNNIRSMNIKAYGDTKNEKSEKIDFQIFNVNQYDKKLENHEQCDRTKKHSKKVEFYCYTRMLNKLSDYVLTCPFVSVNHNSLIRAWLYMNDIVLIHQIYSERSAIYMMVDLRKPRLIYESSFHLLMNLILHIFNNSQYFDKTSKEELILQIDYETNNNNIQLEFLNSQSTQKIAEDNILYLIEKYYLNHRKSYNDLINDFKQHLYESIYDHVKDDIVFVSDSEIHKLVDHWSFMSIIDICNIIPQICGSKFDVIGVGLPEKIKKEATVLERCLILEIEADDFLNIIDIEIEGHGDLCFEPLNYIRVNQSSTFIVGCNQLYGLYKKKICLKIILKTKRRTLEEIIDVSDIIPVDTE